MKKLLALILSALMLLTVLVSCGGGDDDVTTEKNEDVLSVSSKELAESILQTSGLGDDVFANDVTAETSSDLAGIAAEDFTSLVKDAYMATAQININAHLVTVIRLNSKDDTDSVREKIKAGFNSMRWVCVLPDQCFIISSGEYIMLAATYNDNVQPLVDAFRTATGDNAAQPEVFFTGEE